MLQTARIARRLQRGENLYDGHGDADEAG